MIGVQLGLRQGIIAAVFALFAVFPAQAQDALPAPQGDVVLTVSGAIAVTNDGATATFDRAMLEALPAETFRTTTIWTEGEQEFTGVPLAALLERLGVTSGTLVATAINDYSAEMPVADAMQAGPVLAYLQNGAPMSRRGKGPLWIVYPYDANADFQTEVAYSRSVWQLDRLTVVP